MHFEWTAPDGMTFPAERWMPSQPPRALILGVPGMGGASSDFRPLGEAAARAGLAVAALNLRGQGLDPLVRRRGAFLDLPALAADLNAFALSVSGPLFLCGESMGALICQWMLAEGRLAAPIRGVIFSAPVVALARPTPPLTRKALRVLSRIVPGLRFCPSRFVSGKSEPLRVTRDEAHAEWLRSAPHRVGAFSLHFLDRLGDLIDASSSLAARIHTPCLALCAGKDVFLRPCQMRPWFDALGSTDKTLQVYPEGYHVLWNDLDRETVIGDILQWIEARVE